MEEAEKLALHARAGRCAWGSERGDLAKFVCVPRHLVLAVRSPSKFASETCVGQCGLADRERVDSYAPRCGSFAQLRARVEAEAWPYSPSSDMSDVIGMS